MGAQVGFPNLPLLAMIHVPIFGRYNRKCHPKLFEKKISVFPSKRFLNVKSENTLTGGSRVKIGGKYIFGNYLLNQIKKTGNGMDKLYKKVLL